MLEMFNSHWQFSHIGSLMGDGLERWKKRTLQTSPLMTTLRRDLFGFGFETGKEWLEHSIVQEEALERIVIVTRFRGLIVDTSSFHVL